MALSDEQIRSLAGVYHEAGVYLLRCLAGEGTRPELCAALLALWGHALASAGDATVPEWRLLDRRRVYAATHNRWRRSLRPGVVPSDGIHFQRLRSAIDDALGGTLGNGDSAEHELPLTREDVRYYSRPPMSSRVPAFFSSPFTLMLLVSMLSLTLTQLPPIRYWWRDASVKINVSQPIVLNHYVGNPHLLLNVHLRNDGGEEATIGHILARLARQGVSIELPAMRLVDPTAPTGVGDAPIERNMGWVILRPDQSWSSLLHFYDLIEDLEPAVDADVLRFANNLLGDRCATIHTRPPTDSEVAAGKRLFARYYNLEPGAYTLTIDVLSESEDVLGARVYRFEISQEESDRLRGHPAHYAEGRGLFCPVVDFAAIASPKLVW